MFLREFVFVVVIDGDRQAAVRIDTASHITFDFAGERPYDVVALISRVDVNALCGCVCGWFWHGVCVGVG